MRVSPLLAVSLLALAGCALVRLPAPHFVRTQPEVDGVLMTAGAPRAGVHISACEGLSEAGVQLSPGRCDRVALATTDAQGRFHLESHGYVETEAIPFGDQSTFEILGIDVGGRELVWHQVWRRPAPERLALVCELNDRRLACQPQVP